MTARTARLNLAVAGVSFMYGSSGRQRPGRKPITSSDGDGDWLEELHENRGHLAVGPRKALNVLPTAILVEAHGRPSGGDPEALPSPIRSPVTESRQEKSADATPTLVGMHDHAQHPWRTVAALVDVELAQTYGAHGPTICGDGDPADRKMDSSGLVTGHRHPERGIRGLRRTTPFAPAQVSDLGYQVRVVPEEAHSRRYLEARHHNGDSSHPLGRFRPPIRALRVPLPSAVGA